MVFQKDQWNWQILKQLNWEKKERTEICIIRNERGDTTTVHLVQRTIKKYYGQLYDHTFDNLDEMEEFLERHNLPKLTQEELENLNRPLFIK